MTRFPRGSEWRKWDLHVHVPGTRLSNNYDAIDGALDWERFCHFLEASDVAAFGITDYFRLDAYFEFRRQYARLYPSTNKVFFPNLELRLNEAVNKKKEEVNLHLIFRDDLSKEMAETFMRNLITEISRGGRNLSCFDLITGNDFAAATVTRESILDAARRTFGSNPVEDYALTITSCKGDGIRAAQGAPRMAILSDAIDQVSHGFFGKNKNRDFYLSTERLEEEGSKIPAKPVFGGSDAHSFSELEQLLGKHVTTGDKHQELTWIKADPSFEGLRQCLIEPAERVRLQANRPDEKEPYKFISRVRFEGTKDFPESIILNSNLTSIIGSRSSGKSALLAHISYAVDPEYTVGRQIAAGLVDSRSVGPAAGFTWDSVSKVRCIVEWGAPSASSGRVIYVPQNSLFSISSRPEEITAKIQPVLFRKFPDLRQAFEKFQLAEVRLKEALTARVKDWFIASSHAFVIKDQIEDAGDSNAIEATRDDLKAQISALREASTLTKSEAEQYQDITRQIAALEVELSGIEDSLNKIQPFTRERNGALEATEEVSVHIDAVPSGPSYGELGVAVDSAVAETQSLLRQRLAALVIEARADLTARLDYLREALDNVRINNAALIRKNSSFEELEALVRRLQKQEDTLSEINRLTQELAKHESSSLRHAASITRHLQERKASYDELVAAFSESERVIDESMTIGVEAEISEQELKVVSESYNRQKTSNYLDAKNNVIALDLVYANVGRFLEDLQAGNQKVRAGNDPEQVAIKTLTLSPVPRFYATLEDDRIGGYRPTSMTPGKQALFALTLILNESEEGWPMLIDQPEDDLDSRSVYDTIVPYLEKSKKTRQIIMVTHNANLVIGADSEQVIIANRHGDDRPNRDARCFDYLSGALEWAQDWSTGGYVLESGGIREHACQILDGGEEAFQKRSEKYRL